MYGLIASLASAACALLGGTLLLLGYRSLLEHDVHRAWIIAAGGFLLLGLLSGGVVRSRLHTLHARLALAATLAAVSIVLVTLLLPALLAAAGGYGLEGVRVHLPLIWPGALFLGFAMTSFRRAAKPARPDPAPEPPSDAEARDIVDRLGLLLGEADLAALRARPGGLRCNICFADHADETDDWLFHWMRCPRVEDHVFHAWHFRDEAWRCPVCRASIDEDPVT